MKKIISIFGVVFIFSTMALPAFAADEELPSDVENLQGTPLNASAKLTWDEATDDVGVEGYQIHYGTTSVAEPGQEYDSNVDVGDVLEYTVTDLENDTTYYFSVIAYDAAGNESQSWAEEVEITPSEEYGTPEDTDAPQVADAEALNREEVTVVFSEEVVLPEEDAQDAFAIENDDTFEALPVLAAEMYEDDETNKTVLLTTADQEEGATYKLTVGIDIEDKAGNPMISGTSDTAIFTGSGEEKLAEDTEGPEVVKVESTDNTHIVVEFNETVVLSIDPAENFNIAEEADATKTLTVLGVELAANTEGVEDASAVITTSAQEDETYMVTVFDLEDEAGNEVSSEKNGGMFQGTPAEEEPEPDGEEPEPDTTAPKDVAELLAEYVQDAGEYIVTLTWKVLEENMGDVTEQIVYLSGDKGEKYDKKAGLGPEAEKYDVENLEAGEYWFKLTQKDAAGNESEGVIAKLVLAETGPEMLALLLVSLGLGRLISRRKRKK